MPDRVSEHINAQLREVRARTFSPEDAAGINAALREAAGIEPAAQAAPTPEQPKLPSLGGSDYALKDDEPLPVEPEKWDAFIHRRRVIRLLDRNGLLPGEPGYRLDTTGPVDPDHFDMAAAVEARRRRWRSLLR
jgi:hypothetical protein